MTATHDEATYVLREGEPVTVYVTPDERRFRRLTAGRVPTSAHPLEVEMQYS